MSLPQRGRFISFSRFVHSSSMIHGSAKKERFKNQSKKALGDQAREGVETSQEQEPSQTWPYRQIANPQTSGAREKQRRASQGKAIRTLQTSGQSSSRRCGASPSAAHFAAAASCSGASPQGSRGQCLRHG